MHLESLLIPSHIGQGEKRRLLPATATAELEVVNAKGRSNNYCCEDEERGVFQESQS